MRRTSIALTVAVPLLVLLLSACGGEVAGEGVATAGTAGPNSAVASGPAVSDDPQERARQFASCMRDQGIDMPDPAPVEGGAGGKGTIRLEAGGAARANPQMFNIALAACRRYLPGGGDKLRLSPEELEKQRTFAKCMRDNGVSEFPDPDANGGAAGGMAFDKGSVAFGQALEKCQRAQGGDGRSVKG